MSIRGSARNCGGARPRRTPAHPNALGGGGDAWASDPGAALPKQCDDLMRLRERLMATNVVEIDSLVADISERYEAEIAARDRRIAALDRHVAALETTVSEQAQRIEAQREVLTDAERQGRVRLQAMGTELDETRSELVGVAQSMRQLVDAHKKAKLRSLDHEKRTRAAEDAAARARSELAQEREVANRSAAEAARLRAELDDLRREEIDRNARIHRLEADNAALEARFARAAQSGPAADARRVEQLTETVTQLRANNARLLKIMAQLGETAAAAPSAGGEGEREGKGESPTALRHALQLFRFIRCVGGDHFRFVGDAALMPSSSYALFANPRLGAMAPMLAQDLRTAVFEHEVTIKRPPLGRAPDVVAKQFSACGAREPDPIVRLRTERDKWIPTPIVHFVSQFRARYFADAPVDLFYTLLVEIARLFREHSSISPAACVERSGPRRAASAAAGASSRSARVRCGVDAAATAAAAEEKTGGGIPSSRRGSAPPSRADVLRDFVALDAVRCVTGLQSLLAAGMGRAGKATPAPLASPEARGILTAALRTIENLMCRVRRLESETELEEELRSGVMDRAVASVMDAIESAMERASVAVLGTCRGCGEQLEQALPMLRHLCGVAAGEGEAARPGGRRSARHSDPAATEPTKVADPEAGGAPRQALCAAKPAALFESVRFLCEAQQKGLNEMHGSMLALRHAFSQQRSRLGL